MFAQRSLDAFVRREAPLVRFLACLSPLKIRAVVVDVRAPDEVHVKSSLQVVSLLLAQVPQAEALPVEGLKNGVLDSLFLHVALGQVTMAVRYFISNLHPHRSFGQSANQRLQHFFGSITRLICMKECVQSTCFIACYEATVCADDAAVQIVSNGQELAKRRLAQRILPLSKGHRHYDSSAVRYSTRCSESGSRAQYTCGFI